MDKTKKASKLERPVQSANSPSERQTLTLQQALDLGLQHHTAGDLVKAESIYQQILQTNPNQPEALHLLGVISHQNEEYDTAVNRITKVLSLKPDFPEAHSNLGFSLQKLGKLEEAVDHYQKAVAINPDYAEAHSNLGVALQKLGQLEEAVTSCCKALIINPEFAGAHYNLGNALKELERLNEAVASYQTALLIKPDFAEAHSNLGNVLKELGRPDEAITHYHKALAIKPDYAEGHSNLGNVLGELGRLDEAIACYQKAIDIKPNFVETFNNMGLTFLPLCHDVVTNHQKISYIEELIDSLPTPPEPDILRLQLRSLTGGDTGEAWNNVVGNMPTIQSETIVNDNSIASPSIIGSERSSPRKMVALVYFGRSGSGYLHSLLDDHPNISTLPGVYMSGFFGREVWDRISGKGFQEIPERFSSLYKVLFDARNPEKIPPAFISDTYNNKSVGEKEGFVKMGPNQDTPLTLDRGQFLENLGEVISGLEDINHGRFFDAIHHAYERTLGNDFNAKKLIFYHLHKIDPYSMANFVKYFPGAELLMIIRNPLQSCESWALKRLQSNQENKYKVYQDIGNRISSMLMDINIPAFQTQPSVAVRLEDIKEHPKETMRRLCAYLGIEETASLYNSTMQGLKWWGDPSSSLFGKTQTQYDEHTDPTRTKTGALFTAHDQFILNTLFYPLSARFGYVEQNEGEFRKTLREIRPLIDTPLDFEQKLAEEFLPDYPELEMTDAFKSLHAVLVGLWHLLDEHGTYPYLMKALPE